jgi:hypothetical protein
MTERLYTEAQAQAACIVMEHWIDCSYKARKATKYATDEEGRALNDYWDNNGVYEMRSRAIEFGVLCEDTFVMACERLGEGWSDNQAFDFDLVPIACGLIAWTDSSCTMPESEQIIEAWQRDWTRQNWMRQARAYAAAHYADDGTVFEQDWLDAYYDGLTAAEKAAPVTATEAVYAYAEKYDLTRIDD